jgi:hypothetical protein
MQRDRDRETDRQTDIQTAETDNKTDGVLIILARNIEIMYLHGVSNFAPVHSNNAARK